MERGFEVRDTYKASLYRNEVKEAYLNLLDEFLLNFQKALHKKPIVKINWSCDSSLGTIDGAIWISHLKAKKSFKLPATYVAKESYSQEKIWEK